MIQIADESGNDADGNQNPAERVGAKWPEAWAGICCNRSSTVQLLFFGLTTASTVNEAHRLRHQQSGRQPTPACS